MLIQKKLYYYTSFGVLYNIITNKEIWLNSLWSMADYTEIKFFVDSVQKDLEASKPEYSTDVKVFFKKVTKELTKKRLLRNELFERSR